MTAAEKGLLTNMSKTDKALLKQMLKPRDLAYHGLAERCEDQASKLE